MPLITPLLQHVSSDTCSRGLAATPLVSNIHNGRGREKINHHLQNEVPLGQVVRNHHLHPRACRWLALAGVGWRWLALAGVGAGPICRTAMTPGE